MVNANLFRAKMVLAGYSQRKLAEAMDMAENTLGSKINGHGYFNTEQVVKLCELLHITDDSEKCQIFLA